MEIRQELGRGRLYIVCPFFFHFEPNECFVEKRMSKTICLFLLVISIKKLLKGTSLIVQWLRIYLPMWGTRIPSLIWEDPMCHGATKPVCRNH